MRRGLRILGYAAAVALLLALTVSARGNPNDLEKFDKWLDGNKAGDKGGSNDNAVHVRTQGEKDEAADVAADQANGQTGGVAGAVPTTTPTADANAGNNQGGNEAAGGVTNSDDTPSDTSAGARTPCEIASAAVTAQDGKSGAWNLPPAVLTGLKVRLARKSKRSPWYTLTGKVDKSSSASGGAGQGLSGEQTAAVLGLPESSTLSKALQGVSAASFRVIKYQVKFKVAKQTTDKDDGESDNDDTDDTACSGVHVTQYDISVQHGQTIYRLHVKGISVTWEVRVSIAATGGKSVPILGRRYYVLRDGTLEPDDERNKSKLRCGASYPRSTDVCAVLESKKHYPLSSLLTFFTSLPADVQLKPARCRFHRHSFIRFNPFVPNTELNLRSRTSKERGSVTHAQGKAGWILPFNGWQIAAARVDGKTVARVSMRKLSNGIKIGGVPYQPTKVKEGKDKVLVVPRHNTLYYDSRRPDAQSRWFGFFNVQSALKSSQTCWSSKKDMTLKYLPLHMVSLSKFRGFATTRGGHLDFHSAIDLGGRHSVSRLLPVPDMYFPDPLNPEDNDAATDTPASEGGSGDSASAVDGASPAPLPSTAPTTGTAGDKAPAAETDGSDLLYSTEEDQWIQAAPSVVDHAAADAFLAGPSRLDSTDGKEQGAGDAAAGTAPDKTEAGATAGAGQGGEEASAVTSNGEGAVDNAGASPEDTDDEMPGATLSEPTELEAAIFRSASAAGAAHGRISAQMEISGRRAHPLLVTITIDEQGQGQYRVEGATGALVGEGSELDAKVVCQRAGSSAVGRSRARKTDVTGECTVTLSGPALAQVEADDEVAPLISPAKTLTYVLDPSSNKWSVLMPDQSRKPVDTTVSEQVSKASLTQLGESKCPPKGSLLLPEASEVFESDPAFLKQVQAVAQLRVQLAKGQHSKIAKHFNGELPTDKAMEYIKWLWVGWPEVLTHNTCYERKIKGDGEARTVSIKYRRAKKGKDPKPKTRKRRKCYGEFHYVILRAFGKTWGRRLKQARKVSKECACRAQRGFDLSWRKALPRIKSRWLTAMRNKAHFDFEKIPWRRPGIGKNYNGTTDPTIEKPVPCKGIAGSSNPQYSAPNVCKIVTKLKESVPVGAGTYKSHSRGAWSVDFFPVGKLTADGYYSHDVLRTFFAQLDIAAKGTKWRCLYTDWAIAKELNALYKRKIISYVHYHGPAPFVLHIHCDFEAKRV
eukprot:TRINITY_DN13715_c0_g1_i1.p1 TRINITY_DN13715_c0_g1~~TRINITY_DN13715_c0_g1_i1.p1  ORF type:complete len:1211 (+),score=302.58 TRINITY_DN13715_c0_g1_i1:110-3742(+)